MKKIIMEKNSDEENSDKENKKSTNITHIKMVNNYYHIERLQK